MDINLTVNITLSPFRNDHSDIDAVKKELIETLEGIDVRVELANGDEVNYMISSAKEVND